MNIKTLLLPLVALIGLAFATLATPAVAFDDFGCGVYSDAYLSTDLEGWLIDQPAVATEAVMFAFTPVDDVGFVFDWIEASERSGFFELTASGPGINSPGRSTGG